MSQQQATQTQQAATFAPAPPSFLQRQCACGGTKGPSGECATCHTERLSTRGLGGGSMFQPKLKVNAPGDRYEQEADRVAEQVMRMPHPAIQREPG